MRKLLLFLILAFILIFAALYTLLAPASLGDYRWVLVALPISLLALREFLDYLPGKKSRLCLPLALVPDQDSEDEESEDQPLDGLWIGAVQIWPAQADCPPQTIPLNLLLDDSQIILSPFGVESPAQDARLLNARILEYEPDRGQLDLELTMEFPSGQQTFQTQLTRQENRFVPEDDTDPVTVELTRTRLVTAPA